MLFFFFKQKTAYEMRISDWSSDVCSSDLAASLARRRRPSDAAAARHGAGRPQRWPGLAACRRGTAGRPRRGRDRRSRGRHCARSEEHTSEIQSIMRISYAVLCLKKKKKKTKLP